jgi:hypothetical protein
MAKAAKPNEKLAESLANLQAMQQGGRRVFRSAQLSSEKRVRWRRIPRRRRTRACCRRPARSGLMT